MTYRFVSETNESLNDPQTGRYGAKCALYRDDAGDEYMLTVDTRLVAIDRQRYAFPASGSLSELQSWRGNG